MMFGTREEFQYFECNQCGCLQLSTQLKDMSKYYPPSYYEPEEKAHQQNQKASSSFQKLILKTSRLLGLKIGISLSHLYNGQELFTPIVRTHTRFNSKILEVGCGKGVLMSRLKKLGIQRCRRSRFICIWKS